MNNKNAVDRLQFPTARRPVRESCYCYYCRWVFVIAPLVLNSHLLFLSSIIEFDDAGEKNRMVDNYMYYSYGDNNNNHQLPTQYNTDKNECEPTQVSQNALASAMQYLLTGNNTNNNKTTARTQLQVHTYQFANECISYLDTGGETEKQQQPENDQKSRIQRLYIGVLSAPENYEQRRYCRTYWASNNVSNASIDTTVKVRFIVGRSSSATYSSDDYEYCYYSELLLREAQRHGDIILTDTLDGDYQNSLARKTFGLIAWSAAANVRLFKVDDDSFVKVPALLQTFSMFHEQEEKLLHYGGLVYRASKVRRTGKWAVPEQALSLATYPPYAIGKGYTLSPFAARCALEEIRQIRTTGSNSNRTTTTDDSNGVVVVQYDKIGSEDALVGLVLYNHDKSSHKFLLSPPVDLVGMQPCRKVTTLSGGPQQEVSRRSVKKRKYPLELVYDNLKTGKKFERASKRTCEKE